MVIHLGEASAVRVMSNIDYVEAMKGPGSALYGRSEPGGTINIITKSHSLHSRVM